MIRQQLTLVLAMFLMGIIIVFVYDILLVGREIIRRSVIWTAIEDFVYWLIAAICTFYIVYRINEGIPRGYAVVGLIIGAALFQWGIGRRMVELLTQIVINVRNYLKKIFNWCRIKLSFQKSK